jgi:putative superfamily III holin-X
VSDPYARQPGADDNTQNIAAAIADVSDRATQLVREEIELAKAEVTQKAGRLARGAAVGVVAGVFLLTALWMALIGFAWLLYYYLPGNAFTYFWGFFAMAVILLLLGGIAVLIAIRLVKRGSPPVPEMAIAEARKTRDVVAGPTAPPTGPPVAGPPVPPGPVDADAVPPEAA